MAARDTPTRRLQTFLVSATLLLVAHGPATASDEKGQSAPPVVLELFTSQGCSSCPPADALLRKLGQRDDIIALSFHVDYWNRLGWEDPYSDGQWSERQEMYVRSLHGDTLYTPQIVINGAVDVVGSDWQELGDLIQRHQKTTPLTGLEVQAKAERTGASVRIAAPDLPENLNAHTLELQLFIAENGIETSVRSGENARRKLRHDHVVRSARRVKDWQGNPKSFQLEIEEDWNLERLELVVLVQDAKTRKVVAAGRQAWPQ